MGCDIEAEEVAFTLLTNKKKNNFSFLFSIFFSNSRSKTLLKTITTCLVLKIIISYSDSAITPSLAITTFKTIKLQIASLSELKTANLIYFLFSFLFSFLFIFLFFRLRVGAQCNITHECHKMSHWHDTVTSHSHTIICHRKM